MFLTSNEDFHFQEDSNNLVWGEEVYYGDWGAGVDRDGALQKTMDVVVPESVQWNGSWFIHVFIVKSGYTIDSGSSEYKEQHITYQSMSEWRERERESCCHVEECCCCCCYFLSVQ